MWGSISVVHATAALPRSNWSPASLIMARGLRRIAPSSRAEPTACRSTRPSNRLLAFDADPVVLPAASAASGQTGGMAVRTLVVEDDAGIRALMRMALEEEGYEVIEAEDAERALVLFQVQPIDIALVDLMLPGMSGFDLCRAMRKTSDVPIVIVTARADTHDVVAGLEAGADDYLTKPFVPKELTARLRALLRRVRSSGQAPERYVFGAVEVVPEAGTVTRDGAPVDVTKTEFRLLCELAFHPGMVLSREQLLERVWGYDYLGDGRLVDAHVRRLRTKIESDPSSPELIVTVRGLGYRLEKP